MIQNISIVAKSFIAPIGANIGSVLCTVPDISNARLAAFARATDTGFSENPETDTKDKGYRIYSACTFTVTCEGGNLVSVVPSDLDTDSGTELSGTLQAPPLTIMEFTSGMTGPGPFSFSWRVKGRPHPLAEAGFALVCPRDSVFIWHSVSGLITCNGDGVSVSVSITGSKFPSHRVFVNGAINSTVTQGSLSNLWVSDPSDITLVQ